MALNDTPFDFYMGDSDSVTFRLREDGANKNMDGLTARFVGKTAFADAATEYVFDIECTNLGEGRVRASYTGDDMSEEVKAGVCEVVVINVDGSHKTFDQWGFIINPDVYRG